jgi:hypothetical protein
MISTNTMRTTFFLSSTFFKASSSGVKASLTYSGRPPTAAEPVAAPEVAKGAGAGVVETAEEGASAGDGTDVIVFAIADLSVSTFLDMAVCSCCVAFLNLVAITPETPETDVDMSVGDFHTAIHTAKARTRYIRKTIFMHINTCGMSLHALSLRCVDEQDRNDDQRYV